MTAWASTAAAGVASAGRSATGEVSAGSRSRSPPPSPASPNPRQRLARSDRAIQLLSVAWEIVRNEGTGALTLGYLAARAGVTKPVVYDHFQDRNGLLAALYVELRHHKDGASPDRLAAIFE